MLLKKAKSFFQAVWSFVRYGEAPLAVYVARRETCRDCPDMVATTTALFCGACGCPKWTVSDLRTKWRMRDVKCPQNKW